MAEGDLVQRLEARLIAAAPRCGLVVKELGRVGEDRLLLLHPSTPPPGPRLLIAAGFHGDEPGGCLGIAEFLERSPLSLFQTHSLSLLPIINPTGLRRCRRNNDWDENPNAGFWHTKSGQLEVSREGRILLSHDALLLPLAEAGFITLHEDVEQTRFYAYTFEKRDEPGPFSHAIMDIGRRFFDLVPDGPLEGGQAQGGLLWKHAETAYEDSLFHRGVPFIACTETPGLLPIELRAAANRALIEGFVAAVSL